MRLVFRLCPERGAEVERLRTRRLVGPSPNLWVDTTQVGCLVSPGHAGRQPGFRWDAGSRPGWAACDPC
jgi:hypothetical protein